MAAVLRNYTFSISSAFTFYCSVKLYFRNTIENKHLLFEPRREKTGILHNAKTKTQISFAVTTKLISAFVFATRIVQSLYYLNPKFQSTSHFLWLYSPVCVGPGRKPRIPVFSQRGSFVLHIYNKKFPMCLLG